jgi:tetratricopeptide (TPR) repeat protein
MRAQADSEERNNIAMMSAPVTNSKLQLDRLQQALQHHRAGRLQEARRLYERVLQKDSRCAEAMHLLGTLFGQQGDPARALEWINKAIAREPGNALYRKNAAVTLVQLGRRVEAIAAYEKALALNPDFLEARIALGGLLTDLESHNEAIALLLEAAKRQPDSDDAWVQLGRALQHAGRQAEAVECYTKAIALNPAQNLAYNNLGVLFDRAGEVDQAVRQFELAVEKNPDYLPGLVNLVAVLVRAKRYVQAEPHLRRLVEKSPDHADGWNSLGLAEQEQQHFEEAERCYLKALAIKPNFADALTNIGNIRFDRENYEEAESFYRRALTIDPGCVEAWNGLRSMLVRKGRDEEALQATEHLLALKPDHPHGRFHLSWTLLSHASFGDGFRDYCWRPSRLSEEAVPAGYRLAEGLPGDLAGKRLLVFKDQGIGDELFFLRFASWLKARGAWVRYLASPKIAPILSRCRVLDEVVTETTPDPSIDFAVNVGDLPFLLGFSDPADTPPPLALAPLPEKMRELREKLERLGPPPYYAITWRAGRDKSRHVGKLVRSLTKTMSMEVIAGYLPAEGTVLSLQRQPNEGETENLSRLLGRPAHDFSALNDDLESMLALLALVDDYVTVSNTNVHLLAGLGRTAKVFVPFPPEWRWLVAGEESPWFPGFRIVRQNRDGSWPAFQPG